MWHINVRWWGSEAWLTLQPACINQPHQLSEIICPMFLKHPWASLSIIFPLCILDTELSSHAMPGVTGPALSLFICAASACRRTCCYLPCMEDVVCVTPSADCTWCPVAAWSCWRKKCYLDFGRWVGSAPVVFVSACVASFEVLVSFCRYLYDTSCYLREAGCFGWQLQGLTWISKDRWKPF